MFTLCSGQRPVTSTLRLIAYKSTLPYPTKPGWISAVRSNVLMQRDCYVMSGKIGEEVVPRHSPVLGTAADELGAEASHIP